MPRFTPPTSVARRNCNSTCRMGWGWRVLYRDRSERTGALEHPIAAGTTTIVASCRGVSRGHRRAGGAGEERWAGPQFVHGVSQLVMLQMTGDWGIHSPALSCLNPQARQSTGVITGGVRFLWVPREQNWVANQRASGIASGALALLVCVSTAPAGVPAPLRKHPAGPNAAAHASFKGCMRPRVGAPT